MNDKGNPEDFEEFMRRFLAGQSGIDPEKFAEAAGLPQDPEALAAMLDQLKNAMGSLSADKATSGVNWDLAVNQAKTIARTGAKAITDDARRAIQDAIAIGSLWLNEKTALAEIVGDPKLLTRELWVADAMPLFQALSQPVANRMSDALAENLSNNAPEELAQLLGDAGNIMRTAGGALFAMQLGQALGKLSQEVLSGGDIGLPIFKDQRSAFLPQNLVTFITESDVEPDQAYIYLVIREMAHARLFRHSKWLRDAVVSLISTYAAEISIDSSRIAEIAEGIDEENMDDLRRAFESGAFIAERTEHQQNALNNIETLLALIEGWVDVVTEEATRRLPRAAAISEAIRRRRATGGPAEATFGTLVGLELRPRRLREAAAMWKQIGEQLGIEKRDSLWNHPDVLPTGDDIDDPKALIGRLRDAAVGPDAFDQALRDLLGE
ncbi:MAG: zinc-dependent metalloprotease [Rhodoluna sp.]